MAPILRSLQPVKTSNILGMAVVFALLTACGGATTFTGVTNDGGSGDGASPSGDSGQPAADGGQPGTDSGHSIVVDLGACSGDGTCVLVDQRCCACSAATASDFRAVERSKADLAKPSCAKGCGCLPNLTPFQIGEFQAVCRAGRCVVMDVPKDDDSACSTNDDCTLRASDCCACGGSSGGWVALNKSQLGTYEKEICPPMTACADCAPLPPAGYVARCDDTKHCVALPIR